MPQAHLTKQKNKNYEDITYRVVYEFNDNTQS
jgi:hypothetical protein